MVNVQSKQQNIWDNRFMNDFLSNVPKDLILSMQAVALAVRQYLYLIESMKRLAQPQLTIKLLSPK